MTDHKPKFADILAALPTLSKANLRAIHLTTATLLGPTKEPEGHTDWLMAALLAHTGQRGCNSYQSKLFTSHAPDAVAFIEKYFAFALKSKVAAISLMRAIINILAEDMKQQRIPVTFNTLANNLHRVGEAFHRAFPGYLDSGMAQMLYRNIVKQTV